MQTENRVTRLVPEIDMTPELMDFYVRQGRSLRARAFSDFFGRLFSSTPKTDETAPAASADNGKLSNSLAAIRSAAELLRDNPGIALAERQRFIDIVLQEEARLESLLGRGLATAR